MCKVVYEDNHLLVVVKPPNMLTQGDVTGDKDLHQLMKSYIKEKYGKPGDVYLGLVHRMDRPVGGLLAFARTSKAAARLSAQIAASQMAREYLCICQGTMQAPFTKTDWLKKDEQQNLVSVVPEGAPGAKKAILHGACLDTVNDLSLYHIRLETGRSHQIRVQMAHGDLPLWGDNRYGKGKPGQQIALWGAKLTLIHPTTKEEMTFFSPPEGGAWDVFTPAINAFMEENRNGKTIPV